MTRFLGLEIGAPTFDFDAVRTVGDTRTLRRVVTDQGVRRFRASFSVEPDVFGDALTAATLDAHFNAHFDGGVFNQEWPQHLGTVPNATIRLTAAAPAGATLLAADLSEAAPGITVDTVAGPVATLLSRAADPAAAGEWAFTSSAVAVAAPLLPGRFVAVPPSRKLHQVVAVTRTTLTVRPGLAAPAPRGAVVDTAPVARCRYAPDMEAAARYTAGVLAERVVVIEEAL